MISSSTGLKLEQYEGAVNFNRFVGFTAYGVADYSFNYSLPTNTWVQLTYVGTPTGTLLYTNGFLCDANAGTISLPMRSIASPTSDRINGNVDEIATFGHALLGGQIATLYLTAVGDANPPQFLNDVPIISPAGTIYSTQPFTLSIDVYGEGPLDYQWRHDGTVVGTSQDYTQPNAALADGGNYDVIVSNAHGSVTSAVAVVTITPPELPTVDQPPASLSIYPGGSVTFTVGVGSGTPPFTYQWMHAGTNLPGATDMTLLVSNIGTAEAGQYTVGVTNIAGGVVSDPGTLTLLTPPEGTYESAAVAAGPVAYWRFGETSGATAFDYAGGHNASIFPSVTMSTPGPSSPAYAGFAANNTAFSFNGTDSGLETGSLGLPGPISVAAWINPNGLSGNRAIVGENASWFFKLDGGQLRFTTPGILDHNSSGASLQAGEWQYVAVTFQPGAAQGAKFYVNGQFISSTTASSLTPGNSAVWIGTNQWAGQVFDGAIDEVAVYNKILSPDTIAAMYAQALYGSTTAPLVLQAPTSQEIALGLPVTFTVQAGGSVPLSYQWSKDGTPIAGATTSVLALGSATFADAGDYTVTIANAVGSADTTATPATLTVLPTPSFANVTNDLVLHLRFDGDTMDSSGFGNNATAVGTLPYIAGEIGQAVHVETTPGINYLLVFDAGQYLAFDENTSFSVGFWINYTTPFYDNPIIGNAVNSTYQLGWVFTDSASPGQLEWSLASTANSGAYLRNPVGPAIIGDGTWHHVLGVVDRQQQMAFAYVDGVLDGSWSIAGLGTLDTGEYVTIGQDPTGNYGTATFDLDDVGIWRRALSAYDALSIYNAAQLPAPQSFDVYGPVKLSIGTAGTNTVIGWQAGTLESNSDLGNSSGWAPVQGATAPIYTVAPGAGPMFYRVHQ